MGDFLYTRAHRALVEVGDLEFLRILTTVANELTIGEMRQLGALEGLEFSEEDYFALIRAKTAVLVSAACETGALCGAARYRSNLKRYGELLAVIARREGLVVALDTAGSPLAPVEVLGERLACYTQARHAAH